MRKRTWLFLVPVLLILTGTVPAQTPPPPNSVTDPTGDSTGGPDLTSASATIIWPGAEIKFSVRFATGTFNDSTTVVQFLLDTDQNPSTGSPGVDGGCQNDSTWMGTDYYIEMGSGSAEIHKSTGGCNNFTLVGSVPSSSVTVLSDGMDVTIPQSLLGYPTKMNFKVTTFTELSPGAYTGVLDYMPDVNLAPGTITVIPPGIQPLSQSGGTNLYEFVGNLFDFKVVDYPGYSGDPVNMILQPTLISKADLDVRLAGSGFAGAKLVPYDGTGGAGVIFRATCEDASTHAPADCPPNPGPYDVKTSWDPTGQTIFAPAFLKAEIAPIGSQVWEDILTAFYESRIDPTGSGRTCCHYSDFVFVDRGISTAGTPLPTITINSPVNDATYAANSLLVAVYSCSPSDGGPAPSSCVGSGSVASGASIDTSSLGTKTFDVTATVTSASSINGSVTYTKSVSYSVVNADNICLLYDPRRSVKKGATYPIKLQVCDASGQNLSDPNIVLNAKRVYKQDSSPDGALEDSGNANPDYNFRFDSTLAVGGGYIYNLSTKPLSTGTWILEFTIGADPTLYSVQFNLK